MNARESFGGLLLAEWTKFRSVTRWMVTLVGAIALTVGLSYLAASGNQTDINRSTDIFSGPLGDPVSDSFYFVHQPVTGDTTLTVRVASLRLPSDDRTAGGLTRLNDPSPFASPAAGLMVKDGTRPGSSYAALALTPSRGVRLQWDFDGDRRGSGSSGPRWLRLVRSGDTLTGYESADGVRWERVGTASPKSLPSTVEVGFYVSSPPAVFTERGGGSSSVGMTTTVASATFDNVRLDNGAAWRGDQIGQPAIAAKDGPPSGQFSERGGAFAVTGTGKVGPDPPDDDMVEAALIGVVAGVMALVAIGVLFATAEYRRAMIRVTLAATPRRGRVLAAKALVLGVTSFLAGLIGVLGSFLLAIPVLRSHGFTPPAFPEPSLSDPAVLRAIVLTAAFMAGVALVGLGIGMLLRHTAAAITVTITLVLLPLIVGMILPGSSPKWLMYTTLAGGLATQRAKPPTITLAEPWALIGPWAGIGVVAAWTALTLGLAWWRLRTRDA
ncbi:ABC transporter permease subunit [Cryptosporangium aurantiacum]|uniref:ABC-type transport system involved in multi-copper enzyme maturation, permease component n=1 Tax=Cryptosporangium aurantiacum TaxID=134849 RepID=A0A1M7R9V1_9ACTN|nr:ABC transporter permease subunit [Cryptosporangium aurantiacum]SHN43097.1 ABC-type transport system involved in multi-copper enzyme maturation, permease component [Cryptosporangium aurantiacum]